jgi:hypothetical protein
MLWSSGQVLGVNTLIDKDYNWESGELQVYVRLLLGPALLGRILASCCKNNIWSIFLVVI